MKGKKESEKENMKIVIVGHVDHGKSTLIGRLFFDTGSLPQGKIEELKKTCEAMGRPLEFGFLMDSLEEERDQAITIDTTQTFFKTGKRNYVIIDAPGHKEFIKNMVTGASLAEAAILIVDANEGIQEQTKRHAYILSLLGMKQVIVVLNKMDLVEYKQGRFEQVKEEMHKFLDKIKVKPEFTIPISAREGDNIAKRSKSMPWFKGKTVLESLDSFQVKKREASSALRMPVQDVYHIGGKRIVAGRVESGSISVGEKILLLPNGTETTVKGIEIFLKPGVKQAFAGQSIGITTNDPLFIDRGNVVCSENSKPSVGNEFQANLFWMAKQPVKLNERLSLRLATQRIGCVVSSIRKRYNSSSLELLGENAEQLNETEVGEVVIKADKPVVFDDFNDIPETGRFVLEKGLDTVAGGIITACGA
ncbi:MAG: 50S ribosome-binding GTPase [Candidatus Diapherotrites archaeon]|uniref:sulfate adenylyltransferase n=1 Tax=Candidatus Iainarchaeum sp. TaxID=3101447 RepID=A0A938YXT1_9ARCH|nr:50S ribosome-binding GTPase [Candidatus Diapherotrites archaeon]